MKGRKEVYYKEGSVLFNDAHNTFNLQLYGDKHLLCAPFYTPESSLHQLWSIGWKKK